MVALLLFLCLSSLSFLTADLAAKIDSQRTVAIDNAFYSIAQIEVEYYRFQSELIRAMAAGPAERDLQEVRRRFDVFYSRIDLVQDGTAYVRLRALPGVLETLDRTRSILDSQIPLIDGPDAPLVDALPTMLSQYGSLGTELRRISAGTLIFIDHNSEASRVSIKNTLLRTTLVTLCLILILILLVMWLRHLGHAARLSAARAQQASARTEAILASSLDAILAVDRDGTVLAFNGAARDIFGYDPADVIGRRMSDLLIPAGIARAHEDWMQRYIETGRSRVVGSGRVQVTARRADGTEFPAEVSISVARSADETIFVAFLRDVSAQLAADAELRRARDDALAGEKAKADLLAVMSHEMRTPLNGLLGTLDLMQDTAPSDLQRRYLRNMEVSGRLLLSHVNDVLDISRLDAGMVEIRREPFDLCEMLTEVVESQENLARLRGNRITCSGDEALKQPLIGDPVRIRQVILNLVGNAVKFTDHGTITIEAEQAGGDGMVELRVSDTGIGMDPAGLARIFDDFVTLDTSYARRSGGTGLGLGISRRLVTAMGGTIGAESEPGAGSMFWVRLHLPFAPKDSLDRTGPDPEGPSAATGMARNILVVEDNEINRAVVEGLLNRLGHRVTLACDGQEGVIAAMAGPYDVILTDISMPRMDGIAATRAIRSEPGPNRDTPIIAMTAHAMPSEIAAFHAAGMQDVLTKPLSRGALTAVLARIDGRAAALPAPEGEASTTALVDAGTLDAMVEDLGRDRATGLLRTFRDSTAADIARLSSGATEDLAAVIADVHRIAGGAGLVGAQALAAALRALETAGKSGETDVLRKGLSDLAALWAATDAALAPWLAADTDTPASAASATGG